VVIASGARDRRLDVDNLAAFDGSCIHGRRASRERVRARTRADVAAGRRALETSRDGVFAGDVRSGSTKRVAAAVGEGAQVIATRVSR
jgi:hypothetical protein